MQIILIGALTCGPEYAIGVNSNGIFQMPWQASGINLTKDLAWFKGKTLPEDEKEVCGLLLGWNTWESLGCRPLKGRRHFIVSKRHLLQWNASPSNLEKAVAFPDFVTAIDAAENTSVDKLFVIGGPSLWLEALPYADKAFFTIVNHTFPLGGEVITAREVMEELPYYMNPSSVVICDEEITSQGVIRLQFCTWEAHLFDE